jgi:hypothetical protein
MQGCESRATAAWLIGTYIKHQPSLLRSMNGMRTKVLPVIHYANDEQAIRNAEIAFDAGCAGVFLIHMKRKNHLLAPAALAIKTKWPDKLVGTNLLRTDPAKAVAMNIAAGLDMTWTDYQITHSGAGPWGQAMGVRSALDGHPEHLVFAGVAFKGQEDEPEPEVAAKKAHELGLIPTTSGRSTGMAAEVAKIAKLRSALGDTAPLALASGVTPENVREFAPHLSHILVATGVSVDFHEFDFEKLYQVRAICDILDGRAAAS